MAMGISGLGITGTLGSGNAMAIQQDASKFSSLVKEMQQNAALEISSRESLTGISSSQISKKHKLNGDYTQGFYGVFTSEADRNARPQGFAAATKNKNGGIPTIDKTSELYAQSLEMENYLVKILVSAMRNTIQHTSLSQGGNECARRMYEDMVYDNISESLTKNASLGLADQIYIELSGQR